MWNSKERRVDLSVAILLVVWWPGGERNVFQSCCGRIRARAKKDHNVSVPRKFTLRFHVSYSNYHTALQIRISPAQLQFEIIYFFFVLSLYT